MVRGTAEVLICHPNTVRHRLRRFEKHSGRSFFRGQGMSPNYVWPSKYTAVSCNTWFHTAVLTTDMAVV